MTTESTATTATPTATGAAAEVFAVALKLGLTSFGGPIAHLGYFREEYVRRRRWLDEQTYADLVALYQFLPGPASSQVGIGIGTMRAGPLGGLAAWLGFTLPSAAALTAFAYGVDRFDVANAGWVHGLKVVAVVAQAVWGVARQFCPDRVRATLALLAALAILAVPTAFAQVLVIAAAGVAGWHLFRDVPAVPPTHHPVRLGHRVGIACRVLFLGLLLGVALLGLGGAGGALDLFTRFYRVGSLVFGSGHVLVPLLQARVVPPGWLTNTQFLAGYGPAPHGVLGAVVARVAIFLPSFLLIWGSLPCWDTLRAHPAFGGALIGINAVVVGILLAALYTPVWTSAVGGPADFGLVVACPGLFMIWTLPPRVVVVFAAIGGQVLTYIH